MRITAQQFKSLGSGRISKKNIERLENGLDPVKSEDQEGEELNWKLLELLLTKEEIEKTEKPGVLEYSHLPNETGVSSKLVQYRKSKQGTRPGVPDYFIAIRNDRGEKCLVWIELKKQRGPNGWLNGSTISDDQKRMVQILHSIPNVAAHFAHGSEEALEIIRSYIFTS